MMLVAFRRLVLQCSVWYTLVIHHNIAIHHNEALPEAEYDGPWNEDVCGDFEGVETGQAVGEHIANTYFQ